LALATGSVETDFLLRLVAVFVLASLVVVPVLFVVGFFASVPLQHALILAVFYCFYLHASGLKLVHRISIGRSLRATLLLTVLLLALATTVTLYDYHLVQEFTG